MTKKTDEPTDEEIKELVASYVADTFSTGQGMLTFSKKGLEDFVILSIKKFTDENFTSSEIRAVNVKYFLPALIEFLVDETKKGKNTGIGGK